MNRRTNRILEIFWMLTAILSLGAAIHRSLFTGFRESLLFFLITIIATAMFMLRRSMRKKGYSE
jgi:hypothetical protein